MIPKGEERQGRDPNISVVDTEWFIPDPDPATPFLEFRVRIQMQIRIQSILFKQIWKVLKKRTLKLINKKNSPTISLFVFQTTVLQDTQPDFTGLKLEIKFLLIFSLIFCWIRRRKSSGSMRIRIHDTAKIWNILESREMYCQEKVI